MLYDYQQQFSELNGAEMKTMIVVVQQGNGYDASQLQRLFDDGWYVVSSTAISGNAYNDGSAIGEVQYILQSR
jgi:hypothetical protein